MNIFKFFAKKPKYQNRVNINTKEHGELIARILQNFGYVPGRAPFPYEYMKLKTYEVAYICNGITLYHAHRSEEPPISGAIFPTGAGNARVVAWRERKQAETNVEKATG